MENQSLLSRVDQYIESGLKDIIVDPDPDLTYTKDKKSERTSKQQQRYCT